MASSVPTGAVLLLNIRRLRAVGPIVFAALLLALFGTVAGVIYAAIYALDKIGPIRFIREDLVQLPLSDATRIYFGELRNLPAAEMVAAVRAFAANPLSVIQVDNAWLCPLQRYQPVSHSPAGLASPWADRRVA